MNMKCKLTFVLLLLMSLCSYAQEPVTITYNFQYGFKASTTGVDDNVLYPQRAIVGGSRLENQGIVDNMAVTKIVNNNATNYNNTFFRFDIYTGKGTQFKINKVRVIQKSEHAGDPDAIAEGGSGNTYLFRVGTQLNGESISNSDPEQSSENLLFSDVLEETEYTPGAAYSSVKNGEYVSVYLTGRGERVGGTAIPDEDGGGVHEDDIFDWTVDEVIIEGEYVAGLSIPTFEVDYALDDRDMTAVSTHAAVSATEMIRQGGESQWKQDRTFSIRLASNTNNLGFGNVGFIYDMNVADGYKAMINNYELKFAGSGEYGQSRVYRTSIYHDKSRDGSGTRVDFYNADVLAGVEKYGDNIKDIDYMSAFFTDNLTFDGDYSFMIGLNRTGKTDNVQLREYFTFDHVTIRGTAIPENADALYQEILVGQDLFVNAVIGSGADEYLQEIVNRYKDELQIAVDVAFDESKTSDELNAKFTYVEWLNEHFRNNTNSRSNVAPVVSDKSIETSKNGAAQFTLEGTDADDDLLKFEIKTQPQHGSVSKIDGAYYYTPNAEYVGNDSFTYVANDAREDSNEGTVSVTVINDGNTAPVAKEQDLEIMSGESLAITLEATDEDGDALTYFVEDQPSNGQLTGTPPNVTYVSNAGFEGEDSFTFKAFDGSAFSNIATVKITVTPIPNNPPVAQDQTVEVMTTKQVDIVLTATDADNDELTFELVDGPSNGILSGDIPNLTYTPNAAFLGEDTFTFKAFDGKDYSNTATITVNVIEFVNTKPVAENQDFLINQSQKVEFTLTATDEDNDPITFRIVAQPENGVIEGDIPNLSYTPNFGFHGEDKLSFVANDGTDDSEVAYITFNVRDIGEGGSDNTAPTVENISVSVENTESILIELLGTDEDNDLLAYHVIKTVENGRLDQFDNHMEYYPNAGFEGEDTFTYTANDGELESNIGTVTITITNGQITGIQDQLASVIDMKVMSSKVVLQDKSQTNQTVSLGIYQLEGKQLINKEIQLSANAVETVQYQFEKSKVYILKLNTTRGQMTRKVIFN
ncbi:tandem-95 repeat protein [Flammeovirga yaeyamensis]|uniref:Tandem-95 repeat protein n=2 Tax=Flammeovirga yaeyamensis TaxID=367791 RepID=A0AAX1NC74_9BACT|nr:Ig-like domain-containing protein [Flammeovirga yaeyamensis]QWG05189.1 tandem-95 repeat protein [Flammeovirga yaeyamensis]